MLLQKHYSKVKEETNKPKLTVKTFACNMKKTYRTVNTV